ncbi:type II and III secretion system protein family protein [Sphingomicrobium lutaoense]|uniref:Pilus assembly protein CpaC n=1 Tax=Sphingomicrobium lutaoense TaxID=515949 RepID=A0A839Z7A3_9SPHN|nr:type II and III secretion system protein family protein [Sphingomicrobium lutaoense]MBB3764694.1 pilus assembly protein CpaC [Sphingomicrobium lutaoense]
MKAAFIALAMAGSALGAGPAAAQMISAAEGVHAGELTVPVNKSQVLRADRPFAKALIGNSEIADVLPLSDQSLYVLGKTVGTTSLTLYDARNRLIAVVDVMVGPDVTGLKRQLAQLLPGDQVGARMINDSIVLEGIVSSSIAADRAIQVAETYAPGKVVNMMSIGSSQQVMLEVRFSEVRRSALKDMGVGLFISDDDFAGAIGEGASLTPGDGNSQFGNGDLSIGSIVDSFGILTGSFTAFGADISAALDALERKGVVTTLAEPTLVALSGETASFLAGGEFPIPVAQSSDAGGSAISVEFKTFGVSLAFTPTVLADGVINMIVAPEVSSIDTSASVAINGIVVPGLQTRRAMTTVELRDGQSFALAGLIRRDFSDTVRQFPILGSIPIIGSLFRSSGFQRQDTELVIVVTPRLVRPVAAGRHVLPTDRATPPDEIDFFLLGKTDGAVAPISLPGERAMPSWYPIGEEPTPYAPENRQPNQAPANGGGMAKVNPGALEKEYGHAL